jgi:hypothetical protein
MRTSELGPPAKVDTDLRPRAREIYFMESFPWRETGLARRVARWAINTAICGKCSTDYVGFSAR